MSLILAGLAWLAGVALGLAFGLPPAAGWLGCVAALGALAAPGASWARPVALMLAVGLVAAGRAGAASVGAEDGPLTRFRGQEVTLLGVIDRAPRCGSASCLFTLRVAQIRGGDGAQALEALVQVRTQPRDELRYGRVVEARGELRAPRAVTGFPRVEVLARQGIREVLDYPRLRLGAVSEGQAGSRLEAARAGLERRLAAAVPGSEGQLVAGLLLGRDVALSPQVRADLRTTGTSHIVAVSGANAAIVGGLVLWLGPRLVPRPWAAAASAVVVLGYTLLVGAPASAVRAAIMFGASALAVVVGRLPDPLTSLVLAAALMAAVDPTLALDLGFQLSFLATAGLVLAGTRLTPSVRWAPRFVLAGLGLTLAAEIATLPLVLYTFHSLSVVAPLANVLIGPLVPPVMALGAAVLLVADVPGVGWLAAQLAWLGGRAVLAIVAWCADLPGASFATGSLPLWAMLAAYGCVLGPLAIGALAARLGRSPVRWGWAGAAAGLLGLGLLAGLSSVRVEPSGGLRARFFDVAGDGLTLIETASGRRLLLGSAGSPLAVSALAEHLPLLDRRLDLLVVTRAGEHDADGLVELARRYPVDRVLGPPPGAGPDPRWAELLAREGVPTIAATVGVVVDLDGVVLTVEEVVEAGEERPAALSVRIEGEGVDLRVLGAGLGRGLAGSAVVVRLAPELGLSRELEQRLMPLAERAVVVGGRAGRSDGGIVQLRIGGGEVLELSIEDGRTSVMRQRCSGDERCAWAWDGSGT